MPPKSAAAGTSRPAGPHRAQTEKSEPRRIDTHDSRGFRRGWTRSGPAESALTPPAGRSSRRQSAERGIHRQQRRRRAPPASWRPSASKVHCGSRANGATPRRRRPDQMAEGAEPRRRDPRPARGYRRPWCSARRTMRSGARQSSRSQVVDHDGARRALARDCRRAHTRTAACRPA